MIRTHKRINWRLWVSSSLNATTYLGLVIVALMWIGVVVNQHSDKTRFMESARESESNLARAYAETVYRSISEIDKTLLLLRAKIAIDAKLFDARSVAIDPLYMSDLAGSVAVIDANGFMSSSNSNVPGERTDLRDREQYLTFLESPVDRLYIGKPVVGRVSGKWLIVFARPIFTAAGNFNGVVVVTVDPDVLTHFFEIIDIGQEGRVTLMGDDRIVRAAKGGTRNVLGQTINSPVWDAYPNSPNGYFYAEGFDGVRRLISFDKVKGYPLIASVGLSERELLGEYSRNLRADDLIAFGAMLLIMIGIGLNGKYRAQFMAAQESILASEAQALKKSRELEITLEHMSQGLIMVDGDRKVAVINHHAVELLGLPEDFLKGQRLFNDVMTSLWEQGDFGKDGETLEPKVREFVRAGGLLDIGTYERTRPNGTVLEVCSVPLPGGGLVRTFTDISVRKNSEARIVHMARHDDLTGLANRVLFRERIEQALARSRRTNEGFGVLLLDLDHFKDVNDTLGHLAGDALLKIVAQRLCQCAREVDTVARLGGDEFAIVQTSIEGRTEAQLLSSRILGAINKSYEILGRPVEIGTSIGIALAPSDGASAEELLKKADLALYTIKSEGRGGWRFFELAMETKALARHTLEFDLRKALQGNEFEVLYQPMIDLASNEVSGAEALLRWNHPQRGVVSPADFISVAEEIGLISEIGEWVARRACADAVDWPSTVKVAINLSPAQFKDGKFVDIIKNVLERSGLPAGRLELEITETVILPENQSNMSVLMELRNLGIGISLDDFGTGYSSLSHLRSFPFTKIKIDKSFVLGLSSDKSDNFAIVRAVSELGKSLNVPTIAEGVETPAQLEIVRAVGCKEAQGFLFSRPVPACKIASAIARRKRIVERVA
jgi:diguanylate cyclase (GGDEF)-like protein